MNHALVSYTSHNIVILMAKGLVGLFPCTARMLGIHYCGVLLFCMQYTKQLLFCPYPYSGLVEMLSSSYPPSTPLWLDLSSNIGSLLVLGLLAKLLREFETFVVSNGNSSVVAWN
jgi:hypothetical protein